MQILLQLGANQSAVIQFFIFAVSIAFLTRFVFNPYFKAYDQRLLKTKSVEDVAKNTIEETKQLNLIFQTHARDINEKIKTVFETKKTEAQAASELLIKNARHESDAIAKKSRTEISNQILQSKEQVATLSKEIAQQLTEKFEGGL